MRFGALLSLALLLAACNSADPNTVAQAVNATLTAVATPSPVVVVITSVNNAASIPTVTQAVSVQQTLAAATETLAATPATPSATPEATTEPSATLTATVAMTATSSTGSAPEATAAPSATSLPTVSATVAATTTLPAGQVLFEDDFSQPSVWDMSEDEIKKIVLAGGQLSFTVKTADRFAIMFNTSRQASNFYATLTAGGVACSYRHRYGLLFRLQNERRYYQFEADCDGRYRLSKVMDGALTPLQDWTSDPAIRAGSGVVNDLSVQAAGATLSVYANGTLLRQITDDTFSSGGFGLYAGAGAAGPFTAVFDTFRVQAAAP